MKSMFTKNQKGFLSLAMVLMMLTMVSIVLAIVYRSASNASLVKYAKEGSIAYQDANTAVETFLTSLRDFDDNTQGNIPENTLASVLCGSSDSICFHYDVTSTTPSLEAIDSLSVVKDIDYVSANGFNTDKTSSRAVMVPVAERITNQVSDFKAVQVSGCSIELTFSEKRGSNTDIKKDVSSFSVRTNTSNNLTDSHWTIPTCNNLKGDIAIDSNLSDTQSQTVDITGCLQSGKNYFIIKEKNRQPFHLDSAYSQKVVGVDMIDASTCAIL